MAAQDALVSPDRLTGPVLSELLTQEWDTMRRTRERAIKSNEVIDGDDTLVLPQEFIDAGALNYDSPLPHQRTVPSRVLQALMSDFPNLSIPLGPKGLGLSRQRLTTKVEQPLNAIYRDPISGFKWAQACATLAYEGWAASLTVTDPAAWEKHPSQWSDGSRDVKPGEAQHKEWAKKYRVDSSGRHEDDDGYDGTVDGERAKKRHELDMVLHRARNVPIRNRILSIRNCAPIFGPDMSVEGLIISQEYSASSLKRKYRFGDAGLMTPNGGNGQDESGTNTSKRGNLTLIEAWLYDEDGIPYVSYAIKGKHCVEARWKGGEYDDQVATIDLKKRFGLDRLPVHWAFGLGNPAATDPDKRAMGLIEPFAGGWRSARMKLLAMNASVMRTGFPIILEEVAVGTPDIGIEDDDPQPTKLQVMSINPSRPGATLKPLELNPVHGAVFTAIELELGMNAEEGPSKTNGDQSGFSQSLAAGFEERALTAIKEGLDYLVEGYGSDVLEAGKRLPEKARDENVKGSGWAPIMVFASSDVPVDDDAHRDPMELDPDLIDETFTVVAQHVKSMSIPEEQQSMEAVARNLKTRRKHLEDTGDNSPETTELELMAEAQRGTPEFQQFMMGLVAQVQGAEELEDIAKGQADGIANETGLPAALGQGVMPPGALPPMQQGAPGVPDGGSVTGMSAPSYGTQSLAGIAAGPAMTGPINNALGAGGALPPTMPAPMPTL